MIEEKISRIRNHLISFNRCYQANKSTLNKKSIKRIDKYIMKIRRELEK